MNFTNDVYWEITFMSLHENPPMEDSIVMPWSKDIPSNEDMVNCILTQRTELVRFKHHIKVLRYLQVDPNLLFRD